MHAYMKTTQNLNLQRQAKLLAQWVLLIKPGCHIRPDGVGVTAKKPLSNGNFKVKHFRTMDEAHNFYFGDTK